MVGFSSLWLFGYLWFFSLLASVYATKDLPWTNHVDINSLICYSQVHHSESSIFIPHTTLFISNYGSIVCINSWRAERFLSIETKIMNHSIERIKYKKKKPWPLITKPYEMSRLNAHQNQQILFCEFKSFFFSFYFDNLSFFIKSCYVYFRFVISSFIYAHCNWI